MNNKIKNSIQGTRCFMSREIMKLDVAIPASINLDFLLNSYPTGIVNSRDYLLYILSKIRINRNSTEIFTSLNSRELKKIVDNYRPLLQWLIDREILEYDANNKYVVSQKCKSYRYKSKFHSVVMKKESILLKTLIKRVLSISKMKDSVSSEPVKSIVGNYYGYEPMWISSTGLANVLGLKRNKMLTGFKQLKVISEVDEVFDGGWYKYSYIKTKSHKYVLSKRFDDGSIVEIRDLVNQYPDLFPKKKSNIKI